MATIDSAAVELFKQKAAPASTRVIELGDLDEAMDYALGVCEKKEFCELLLPGCELPLSDKGSAHCVRGTVKTMAAPGLEDRHFARLEKLGREKGFSMLRQDMRGQLAGMDVAFTLADLAIAETATCILQCYSEDLRLATMLCEVHVIALKKSQIVKSSADAMGFLQGIMEKGPMYTAFISGPSRTADIERVLTLGVHGPLELHIALVEG
ncbi:lactate utilization protein [Desulfovibrio sp. OttesenSCG-928-A18]|nr:lactate utilization protein [Desulfovibrio sp. OttesenSCG-928-A18]